MNTTRQLAIAAFAAFAGLAAAPAIADEADASQFAHPSTVVRSVADVKAEARNPVRITNGGTGFIGVTQSAVDPVAVKNEGVKSARNGQTARGEFGPM
ncbi:MAG: DUF4148 domain-containing protein [Pseudomonadota bacterium]